MVSANMTSPSQKIRLSSDIDEEDFLLNFDQLAELYCDSTDRLWVDDTDPAQMFPDIEEWLNTASTNADDSIFQGNNNYNSTPGNTNRPGIARRETITKRRVDEPMVVSNLPMTATTPLTSDKFGTITKRYINGLVQSEGPVNRTFEIGTNTTFNKSMSSLHSPLRVNGSPLNNTFDVGSNATFDKSKNNLYSPFMANRRSIGCPTSTPSNGLRQFQQDAPIANVNSNTITKNRKSYVVKSGRGALDTDGQTSDCITIVSGSEGATTDYDTDTANSYTDSENFAPGGASNGYAKYGSSDTEESTASLSGKNYPTISRNNTKTLLRQGASQGQLANRNASRAAANSNDDLLTSDSSEVSSTQSNLSTTSSISGRSEPNLLRLPNAMNGQRPKLLARPSAQVLNSSRLPNKPSMLATGNNSTIVRKSVASKLANPINNFGGSVGSLPQSGIGRASSQTLLTTLPSETMTRYSVGGSVLDVDDKHALGSLRLVGNTVSRNSTFRVNRPQPVMSVVNVFSAHHQSDVELSNKQAKCNSDDNILHNDRSIDLELKAFRAKVLSSNAYGNRSANTGHSRSSSPSSNSSCSSTSSSMTKTLGSSNLTQLSRTGTIVRGAHSRVLCQPPPATNNNTLNDALNNNNPANVGVNRPTPANPNLKTNSRIPALTLSSNRSNIPASGIPQLGCSQLEPSRTLVRTKVKAGVACQEELSTSSQQFADNSWQTDCF